MERSQVSTADTPLRLRSRSWRCSRPSVFSLLVMPMGRDCVLQLSGSLDETSATELLECVAHALDHGPRQLVVELSGMEHLDASGIDALTAARQASEARGIPFVLDSPPPAMRQRLAERGFSIR
jgi:anti-anti-sigma factor